MDSLIDEATGVAVAAIAEFAATHGVSTNAGRQLIGDAVELHDRLPRCWHQMLGLRLPAWKARLLAQTVHHLGDTAVAWVDAQASLLGDKLGVRTIKRLALLAQARFEPDTLTDPVQRRWVRIGADTDSPDGRSWLDGCLDTPDALDLDAALRLIAADLATDEDGKTDLDARRAHALGIMARRALGQPELPTTGSAMDPDTRSDRPESDSDKGLEGTGRDSADGKGAGQGSVSDRIGRDRADKDPDGDPVDTTSNDESAAADGETAAGIEVSDEPGSLDDAIDAARTGRQTRTCPDFASPQPGSADARRDNTPARPVVPSTGAAAIGAPVTGQGLFQRAGRPVMIYLHLDATQLTHDCGGLAEVGTTSQLVTVDQIRRWCKTAGTITIRPVIDLNRTRTTHSYQPTDIVREQIALRDRTCVFPHCTRIAHPIRQSRTGNYSHDADHITPYDSGGDTATDNLACLCRLHHLLKTHTGWRYEMIGLSEYLWTSPNGHHYLRTNNGTTMLTTPRQRGKPKAA
ncbi:MAG: hypothetical protein QM619_14615 [Micropruina sp.]|uniref:HNH endonuclease signature motif containing protein n=1 Tax=Micropruina sp. TaxID=2737536 RepID=UPI0039E5DA23